jgi:putative transposase
MGKKRRVLGEQDWMEIFDRFEGAGDETLSSFCKREDVATSSFYRWRAVLGRPTRSERLAMTGWSESTSVPREPVLRTPTAAPSAPPSPAPNFIELGSLGQAATASGRLEIRLDLGGGLNLHIVRG